LQKTVIARAAHFSVVIATRLKRVGFFLKISKEIGKASNLVLGEGKKNRVFSVSPQSRTPLLASFQTFCLTARAYLNTQKYGLLCSLRCNVKLLSYTFCGEDVVYAQKHFVACVSVRFSSLPLFHLTVRSEFLVSLRRYIMLFFQRHSSPSFFKLSLGLALSCRSSVLVELHQPVTYFIIFSFFLFLHIPNL